MGEKWAGWMGSLNTRREVGFGCGECEWEWEEGEAGEKTLVCWNGGMLSERAAGWEVEGSFDVAARDLVVVSVAISVAVGAII
jgi:hypothetical protein